MGGLTFPALLCFAVCAYSAFFGDDWGNEKVRLGLVGLGASCGVMFQRQAGSRCRREEDGG